MEKEGQWETVILSGCDGKERRMRILVPDAVPFAHGTRSEVFKVLAMDDGPEDPEHPSEPEYMAMKVYTAPELSRGFARNTMYGHQSLNMNLPESEKHRLTSVSVDNQGRLFMPLLSSDAWVVSMGYNDSRDREELREHKLDSIPNFNEVLTELLDAVEHMGRSGVMMGSDVYLFTVDHKTRRMYYRYVDKETVKLLRGESPEETALTNLRWALDALKDFLQECVEDPAPYLTRLRQEVLGRMYAYGDFEASVSERVKDVKKLEWPALNWKQTIASQSSWLWTLFTRHIKQALTESR